MIYCNPSPRDREAARNEQQIAAYWAQNARLGYGARHADARDMTLQAQAHARTSAILARVRLGIDPIEALDTIND